jgi:hypothetical protein
VALLSASQVQLQVLGRAFLFCEVLSFIYP